MAELEPPLRARNLLYRLWNETGMPCRLWWEPPPKPWLGEPAHALYVQCKDPDCVSFRSVGYHQPNDFASRRGPLGIERAVLRYVSRGYDCPHALRLLYPPPPEVQARYELELLGDL